MELTFQTLCIKGFETVEARIHAPGGHSSRPPLDKSSVLEVMGRLLTSVSNMPPPLRLVEPVPAMLKAISPGASSSFYRYIFRHSQNRFACDRETRDSDSKLSAQIALML